MHPWRLYSKRQTLMLDLRILQQCFLPSSLSPFLLTLFVIFIFFESTEWNMVTAYRSCVSWRHFLTHSQFPPCYPIASVSYTLTDLECLRTRIYTHTAKYLHFRMKIVCVSVSQPCWYLQIMPHSVRWLSGMLCCEEAPHWLTQIATKDV